MIKTSLIITVNNRSNLIRKSLLSLQNQSVKPDELILSDIGSDEEIIKAISIIVKKFAFPVKYIRQEDKHQLRPVHFLIRGKYTFEIPPAL